jgi:hypothetical protein
MYRYTREGQTLVHKLRVIHFHTKESDSPKIRHIIRYQPENILTPYNAPWVNRGAAPSSDVNALLSLGLRELRQHAENTFFPTPDTSATNLGIVVTFQAQATSIPTNSSIVVIEITV